MNSSQTALVVGVASILISAGVLTTAQLRVLARPEPRTKVYLVAWLVTLALLGGLRTASDFMVGTASPGRIAFSLAWIAIASAVALVAGHRVPRKASLIFVVHAVVMTLASYI